MLFYLSVYLSLKHCSVTHKLKNSQSEGELRILHCSIETSNTCPAGDVNEELLTLALKLHSDGIREMGDGGDVGMGEGTTSSLTESHNGKT